MKEGKGKLKACPFCGSGQSVVEMHDTHWIGMCIRCYVSTPWIKTKALAIKAWNRRHK